MVMPMHLIPLDYLYANPFNNALPYILSGIGLFTIEHISPWLIISPPGQSEAEEASGEEREQGP